jgi:hypothetical protein
VHERPVRRQETRGEVRGRPGGARRHVRGPAPARPTAALPVTPLGIRGLLPIRRGAGEEGRSPLA